MKTIAEFVNLIDADVPNNIATTNKYRYLADIVKDIKEWNTYYDTWDTNTSTSAAFYNYPSSNMVWTDILWLGVSNSTYDVAISASTMPYSDYTEYKYKGLDESVESGQWIESGTTGIHITGLSTENKHWLRYRVVPDLALGLASSDSTTIVKLNDILTDYVYNKLAVRVCRSGSFPRIDLSNNFEMEAQELLGRAKTYKKNLDTRMAKTKVGYRDWWD